MIEFLIKKYYFLTLSHELIPTIMNKNESLIWEYNKLQTDIYNIFYMIIHSKSTNVQTYMIASL